MILEISDLVVKSIVEPKFYGRTKAHGPGCLYGYGITVDYVIKVLVKLQTSDLTRIF